MEEIWKDIEGFEGFYQISNTGKVKSLPKTMGNKNHLSPVRILKNKVDKYGYECIKLCDQKEKGKIKYRTIHRLVANAFIDNPQNLKTVNHKDGNKLNNNVSNLEWASVKQNIQHAWDIGLKEKVRKRASEFHGQKCKLINIETNEELVFESLSKLSLFLGYNSHWLSSAINNGTNYKKSCERKGYLIELEV
ncbi:NUMOD4 domain-containing protein [Priestia aryabhattai]|uniref:NUMOD4 domain-containing protein n=1 Tax=Priestia aryabhattai TaxID=412384 RepID=UPI0015F682A3|nr:NUMOD4 domain-containing protein [Priestia aryabhattai]